MVISFFSNLGNFWVARSGSCFQDKNLNVAKAAFVAYEDLPSSLWVQNDLLHP
jgi:hypothetical protein